MSKLPGKIPPIILDSSESPSLFVTHHTKYMVELPSFPGFEWDFLVIDTPKGEDLILGFDFLNHLNPSIDWRQGLITFNADHKDYSDPSKFFCNDLSSAKSCAAVVGDSRTPSFPSLVHIPSINSPQSLPLSGDEVFKEIQDVGEDNSVSSLHLFFRNMDLPPLSYHDSLEELWDEEEKPEEIETVMKFLPSTYHQYLDVFSKVKAEKLPPHRACDHHIELEGSLPPVGVIYSLSKQESDTLRAYILENVEKSFIWPSSSSTGAPVLFVKKKDGGFRLCVVYRKLNAVTRKNKYPVPPMNQLLNVFNGSSMFSKIYLRGAYNLCRIKEGNENLTCFRTKYRSLKYLVMPFGLTNAPASFQNLVNDIFQDMLDVYVVVDLDDILVFSKSEEQHVTHVVEYLGYVVSSEGLKMDQAKVQQILNWPPQRNLKALQSFLGFANFYCRFIKTYSKKISSLTSFLKKDSCFPLNEEALSQFHQLKEAFTTAPILSHFNPSLPTIVETDASNYALGAVLSQVSDSAKHPIAFNRRKLIPAELNYEIHDKELLGIVWAFKRWRAFLLSLSSHFEVLTNHSSLQYFMSSKILTCSQAFWAEFLSEFHFSITYHPGPLATLTDAFSCWDNVYPEKGEDFISKNPTNFQQLIKQDEFQPSRYFAVKVESFSNFIDSIQKALWQDSQYISILRELGKGKSIQDYSVDSSSQRLLFKDWVVVPNDPTIQLSILQKHHDSPLAGQPGQEKTLKLVKLDFHWSGMTQFIKDYVSSCQHCSRNKNIHHKKFGLLKPLPIPNGPWSFLSMDFITQFPLSNSFDSILVIVDRFSKVGVFISTISSITSLDLAHLFIKNIFSKHCLPSSIVSDRGPLFVSSFRTNLCQQLKISRDLSTA
ncbi:hypothetical protein O181_059173 [Austropuccinia psidii MF-1]|uniref:Integrase catalytic domain-containing protein n=1 Tax=Austropuccinia psidii MF-1 TaxID=1389203 RepID=A0A9Q3HW98_9BASI|nr:hypothetical protein [Austropuccinia psidii MF-1]